MELNINFYLVLEGVNLLFNQKSYTPEEVRSCLKIEGKKTVREKIYIWTRRGNRCTGMYVLKLIKVNFFSGVEMDPRRVEAELGGRRASVS